MNLREAQPYDKQFFLDLRNDPDAVRFSYSRRPVTQDEHDFWWDTTGDYLYVAEALLGAVGTLRITPVDESTCMVHIAVGREFRGAGYAREMLQEATQEAKRHGFTHMTAHVDSPNTASLRAFLRAGYAVTSPGTLLLERDL